MRIIGFIGATIGGVAVAATLIAAPPAAAGKACNELGLGSPCIKSNDLKARINLRESGKDGRLQVRDANNATAVSLDGSSGNVTNLFSNEADQSNGLVKAWARINFDGTIDACWRCNTDPNETRRVIAGAYEVDFTPLATDIMGRPLSGSIVNSSLGMVVLVNDSTDPSSVVARTFSTSGIEDRSFVVIVY
jgi:hypothetical protein